MSVDRPDSYLTNLDLQIRINRSGMTVSGRDLSAGRSGRDGERVFVDLVGRASGAATAELVNARGRQAENEPDLDGEIVAGRTEPQAQVLPAQVLPAKDPLSPQHDPALLAAKEIRKPDAPVFVAGPAPVVIGKEPAQRGFDLPPQHIIDAKTIIVHETPIGVDAVPLEPVTSKYLALESGPKLPLSENLEQILADTESALSKALVIPPERLREVCTNAYDELVEKMNGVVEPFAAYTEEELRRMFDNADDAALIRHYLETEVRPLLEIVLSRACRNILPDYAIEAGEEMEDIVGDIERALNIEYDPGLLERIGQRIVDGARSAVGGVGEVGERIGRWFRGLGQDPSQPVSPPPFPIPRWDRLRQPQ